MVPSTNTHTQTHTLSHTHALSYMFPVLHTHKDTHSLTHALSNMFPVLHTHTLSLSLSLTHMHSLTCFLYYSFHSQNSSSEFILLFTRQVTALPAGPRTTSGPDWPTYCDT